jgi:hypothetical protein
MQLDELIEKFNYRGGGYPKEFIDYILANREEFTPLLIEILQKTASEADKYAEDQNYLAHLPALTILAYFREKAAFPAVLDMLKIKPEWIDFYLGDFITESLDSVIASVFNGDIKALEDFIINNKCYGWCNVEALNSLVILFYNHIISRDELIGTLSRIFDRLDKTSDEITNNILDVCRRTHLQELIPQMEKLYADDDFADFWIDDYDELIGELKNTEGDYRHKDFINDVEEEIAYIYRHVPDENDEDYDDDLFDEDFFEDDSEDFGTPLSLLHPDTYVRETRKVGRNEPCPCGSGKKYKKCCG